MTGVLGAIVEHKRQELVDRRRRIPLDDLRRRVANAAPPRGFLPALRGPGIRLIAEVKGASPSAGTIRADFDPAAVARGYEAAGAAAISVLTDARYFHGADAHLAQARRAVGIPVLRKDFVVDPYQVYEARAIGADAVLLIVAILPGGALADLQALAQELGMAALVEVHAGAELERATAVRSPLVGINNRNLDTLETSLEVSRRLRPRIAEGATVVAESGIETREQVEEMERLGMHAVLVGTALMRAPDPAARLRELLGIAE
ncbi:MAG TPA: indole-3-glycerol phosphate synthase TrpC [bacterium]|nr:indole-3-glycerol phosphate synthase TrpC [bacterium]